MTDAKRDGYRWGKKHLDLPPQDYNEQADREAQERYQSPDAEVEFYAGAVERRMRGSQ